MSSTSSRPLPIASSTVPRTPWRRSTPLLDQLDREWAALRTRRTTRDTVRSWVASGRVDLPDSTIDLECVLRAAGVGADGWTSGDHRLRELVDLAATDDLAGRVVIQRLLPGLVSGARRWRPVDGQQPIDLVVGAAWVAIRRFDPSRTASQVAPALISDSLWLGLRRDARRRSHTEVPMGHDSLALRPARERVTDPTTALAGTIRAARRAGVADKDVELLRNLAQIGSPSALAEQRGVTVRTIRNHRDIAVREVRRALGPDWSDWSDPLTAVA